MVPVACTIAVGLGAPAATFLRCTLWLKKKIELLTLVAHSIAKLVIWPWQEEESRSAAVSSICRLFVINNSCTLRMFEDELDGNDIWVVSHSAALTNQDMQIGQSIDVADTH